MTDTEVIVITALISLAIVAFWLGYLWLSARRENNALSHLIDVQCDHILDLCDAVNDYQDMLDKQQYGEPCSDKDFDTADKVMNREG